MEANRSISVVKSVVEARALGCVSIRFQSGSELGGPESSALLRAKRERTPGYCRTGLWREISAFHCWRVSGHGAGRRDSACGRIWQRRAFLRWAACQVNSQWTSGTRSMGLLGDSSPARSMRNWSGDEARRESPKGDTCAAAVCWSWWSASEEAAARYASRSVMAPWYVPQ